jgi:uncharacterized protein YgbK (DUF1537 family)
VADDLSGAADCAAAFARVCGPVPVALGTGQVRLSDCMAIDTDSRAMERAAAVAATARAFDQIARSGLAHQLVYKKIDSTLRGHIGAELEAALGAAPRFAGAVVAPSFPQQGRTLSGGRLCLQGQLVGEPGQAGDLMSLLRAAGLQPALLAQPLADPVQITLLIQRALAGGARAVVVDGADPDGLARLATALCAPAASLLVAGSAGLARALAQHFDPKVLDAGGESAAPVSAGPVLTLVGSFAHASTAQVQQVEASGDAQVIRLDAGQWTDEQHGSERRKTLAAAHETLRSGRNLLFAIGGAVTQPFSRSLVQAMARSTAPLLRHAGTCVLTGGDTARAVFNELAVDRLDVTGEFEPGISLARARGRAAPQFVLKAGGFGDAPALERIIRHFGPQRHSTRRALAPS